MQKSGTPQPTRVRSRSNVEELEAGLLEVARGIGPNPYHISQQSWRNTPREPTNWEGLTSPNLDDSNSSFLDVLDEGVCIFNARPVSPVVQIGPVHLDAEGSNLSVIKGDTQLTKQDTIQISQIQSINSSVSGDTRSILWAGDSDNEGTMVGDSLPIVDIDIALDSQMIQGNGDPLEGDDVAYDSKSSMEGLKLEPGYAQELEFSLEDHELKEERPMVEQEEETIAQGEHKGNEGEQKETAGSSDYILPDPAWEVEGRGRVGTPFWFENAWLSDYSFKSKFCAWWEATTLKDRSGYSLMRKIRCVKEKIREWNKSEFGALSTKEQDATTCIARLDSEEKGETWD
ncbi:hypothetical protein Scep_006489 [Stephania cephalantha]|uniref:Uncharacterized protein n=1 Tax=Stephania cephalantha TaxID=152367 RepID=A0AAP0K893_9MAGN